MGHVNVFESGNSFGRFIHSLFLAKLSKQNLQPSVKMAKTKLSRENGKQKQTYKLYMTSFCQKLEKKTKREIDTDKINKTDLRNREKCSKIEWINAISNQAFWIRLYFQEIEVKNKPNNKQRNKMSPNRELHRATTKKHPRNAIAFQAMHKLCRDRMFRKMTEQLMFHAAHVL